MAKYLYYILLLFPGLLHAQLNDVNVSLNWDFNEITKKYEIESDNQYIYEDYYYIRLSERNYLSKLNFELFDFHFLDIDSSEVPDSLDFAEKLEYSVNWAKGRNGWVPTIRMKPLIDDEGNAKLLSSFKLKETVVVSKRFEELDSKFTSNSVLSDGNWVKLSIDKSGVYKIDNSLMGEIASKLGIGMSEIDPRNIAIYGQRGSRLPEVNSDYNSDDLKELAIEVFGEDDGVFSNEDYLVFYAEGAIGQKVDVSTARLSHVVNTYTDNTFVFITVKGVKGKRIEKLSYVSGDPTMIVDTYNSFAYHELEEVNFIQSGQMWFGERLERNPNLSIKFDFPDRVVDRGFYVETAIGVHPETYMRLGVKANGSDLYTFNFGVDDEYYTTKKNSNSNSSKESIDIDFSFSNGGEGECLLDYIEVNAISKLVANNKQYSFRNVEAISNMVSEYRISNPSLLSDVWNITNPLSPKKVELSTSSGYSSFKEDSGGLEEYQLIVSGDYYSPEVVSRIENQNLHSHSAVDYLIITHNSLHDSAEKLAAFHRGRGLEVSVIDVEDIYNEFSAGRQDLVAIRQFVKMVYEKGGMPSKLKYLLMFGDSSYDFKNRIENNTNLVPAYQAYISTSKSLSFVSDDYFGFMDDHEGGKISGSDLIDIAIGRIPVMTDEEGNDVVRKIEEYSSSSSFGDWRNKVQLISDDYKINKGSDWEINLIKDTEKLSDWLSDRDSKINHQKVYLDSYKIERTSGGNTYPQAHLDFMQNVQTGNLVTNFFGHGSETKWTGEGLFNIDDVEKFSNINNLPLFITITCEFSRYDNPAIYSGGEKLMTYKDGGGVGLISTTREMSAGSGNNINRLLFSYLFPENTEDYKTIGEVLMLTKNMYPSGISKRIVSLLGDPALMLAYPKKEIKVNSINYNDVESTDSITIMSMMKVHIEGEINYNGQKDTGFNGVVYPLFYDKRQYLESFDNNNVGKKVPFWVQNNVIYNGTSSVVDGEFVMEFVVPKDINFSYGKGKLSFYAVSDKCDASGGNSDVIVGGIDVTQAIDSEGPSMDLYMNNEFFDDGGITNSSPVFIADLEDESGINTVGNGIGHDLKMLLTSENIGQEIILNEYYVSKIDDFSKGKVSYQLLGLDPGQYKIEFIAWDVFNNSSTGQLHFTVKDDDEMVISNTYNYPNPFPDKTTFKFSHNKPNEALSTMIEIYTISGALVKTLVQYNNYDGFVVNDIVWEGKSDSGALLPTGTYIYKISTIGEDGSSSNQVVNKLMIIR